MMKVSIITACLNNATTIETTLQSVLTQDYPNLEYIIIDGASADGTKDIIAKYKDRLGTFISEKDNGIYNAMNKGLSKATGDIVGFLHADDFYPAPDVISKIVKAFESSNCECVYGDLQYVDRQNPEKIIRNWKSEPYYNGIFLKGFMPPHPTFFLKRKWYEQYGNYNTAFALAADYELMLRMLHRYKLKATYIPEVLVKMRTGGASNKSLGNRIKANMEDRKAWKANGLKPTPLTLIRKPLGKLGQYF